MKGLTLIEILVSLSVILIVAGLLISALASFRENNLLTEAQSNIIGMLRDARSRTLGSVGNSAYGIHFEAAKAVLFKGESYDALDPANEAYNLPSILQVSDVSLGGLSDVVFSRLTGVASSFGTVTIESKGDSQKTRVITILSTGIIK